MNRIVTISYTAIDAPGGVPRWNRDFHSVFQGASVGQKEVYSAVHYCWEDFPGWQLMEYLPEWEKAKKLNEYLLARRLVKASDIIVADGFWLSGLEMFPYAISVCHGIWGHITKDDLDKGIQPENPLHHQAQVAYRQKLHDQNKRMVAVSDFISDNLKNIWGWDVPVINTGIDLSDWQSHEDMHVVPVFVHGVNDKTNVNKGWSYIQRVQEKFKENNFFIRIVSLDELASQQKCSKQDALGQADLCLIPSGYEGNSLFTLEALACDLPLVCYDVGLPYLAKKRGESNMIGTVLDRNQRSEEHFANAVLDYWTKTRHFPDEGSRSWVSEFSFENFANQWREYIEEIIK